MQEKQNRNKFEKNHVFLYRMSFFRNTHLRKLFTLLAGLTFLNMSFILAEFAMLDLKDRYKTLIQNIINTGLEEEKEIGGETEESEFADREVIFLQHHLHHFQIRLSSLEVLIRSIENQSLNPGFLQRFSPPPELG